MRHGLPVCEKDPKVWPWQEALGEAQLSPLASAAFGRSMSLTACKLATDLGFVAAEPSSAAGEARSLAKLALPLSIANLVGFLIGTVTLGWALRLCRVMCALVCYLTRRSSPTASKAAALFDGVCCSIVGRLGEFELSAVVLGTSLFNVTGLSVLVGFTSALETVCGQAFGAGNHRLLGVAYQRALVLTTLLFCLIASAWTQIDRILLLLK
jgi:MATE family multidrug resistance protein